MFFMYNKDAVPAARRAVCSRPCHGAELSELVVCQHSRAEAGFRGNFIKKCIFNSDKQDIWVGIKPSRFLLFLLASVLAILGGNSRDRLQDEREVSQEHM